MEETQTDLIKGRCYKVELYPKKDIVNAKYLGKSKGTYVFSASAIVQCKYMDGFLLVDEHWMRVKDDGIITYQDVSSSVVGFLSWNMCKFIGQRKENSDLVEKLREVGVNI